jgi:hypothetical protein
MTLPFFNNNLFLFTNFIFLNLFNHFEHQVENLVAHMFQLEGAYMLDACCYSVVVVYLVLATYLPLPYSG